MIASCDRYLRDSIRYFCTKICNFKQGEKLVEENLSKVTEEEKIASVAMTQELEDYLRDEVRPLQAENKKYLFTFITDFEFVLQQR